MRASSEVSPVRADLGSIGLTPPVTRRDKDDRPLFYGNHAVITYVAERCGQGEMTVGEVPRTRTDQEQHPTLIGWHEWDPIHRLDRDGCADRALIDDLDLRRSRWVPDRYSVLLG
jgi:hypothetical protein